MLRAKVMQATGTLFTSIGHATEPADFGLAEGLGAASKTAGYSLEAYAKARPGGKVADESAFKGPDCDCKEH
jgi:hypothetical protein